MSREIHKIAVIGAGAVGGYLIWGMTDIPGVSFDVIADGTRAERLCENGLTINGKAYRFPVVSADYAAVEEYDLILISCKYYHLDSVVTMLKKLVRENTIVLSLLNGVDSESRIEDAVGAGHVVPAFMRITSQRNGKSVCFAPEVTQGLYYGEADGNAETERIIALKEFFARTRVNTHCMDDILTEQWIKFAQNCSGNLPQAVIGVGAGSYEKSSHLHTVAEKMWEEVRAVAKAKGIILPGYPQDAQKKNYSDSARWSTLQDLDAHRHTEIDMFAGTVIRYGKEYGIETPYHEAVYHFIKALEEKNDGLLP